MFKICKSFKTFFSVFCILFSVGFSAHAAPISSDTFKGHRIQKGAIGGFLDPAFYVGSYYQTQHADHVHIAGKAIWPYLLDVKARKTFGFVGVQVQHSTRKEGSAQGVFGLRHLWGSNFITGAFLGSGAAYPNVGSGWIHDAFGGLEFYLGMFSLTGIYHYPFAAHTGTRVAPGSFHFHAYAGDLARLHYRTERAAAYRGGEGEIGAQFLPHLDLRAGYYYYDYDASGVKPLQGPVATLSYEHLIGRHILGRLEGLVRYDLNEGWSGRVGLWIGLNRTPLRFEGLMGRFAEFPTQSFEVPIHIVRAGGIAGRGGSGGSEGPGNGLPYLPEPANPDAGYVFEFVHNEQELTDATNRSDVDVALINEEIQLTGPIVQSNMPKVYAGEGIELPIEGVMTTVDFPNATHRIIAAPGQPLIRGTGAPLYFHFLHLTVSDVGILVDYSTPPAVGTRFAGEIHTYGKVVFFKNTIDAPNGGIIYAGGKKYSSGNIAHQDWAENTINANVLDFHASSSGQAEFYIDNFKSNTVTAEPQNFMAEGRKIQFIAKHGETFHIGNVTGNKLTNIGFAFTADSEGTMTIENVANNEVAGQTFEGYSFEALDEAKLTLASFDNNRLTTSVSLPAGYHQNFHPVFFYADEGGHLTVTGAITKNNVSTSSEVSAWLKSGIWTNMAKRKGTITFEGPFTQNNIQHEDRNPTGTPLPGHWVLHHKVYDEDALLKFEAQNGGQVVVKEAISNNILTGTGYFSGIYVYAFNDVTGLPSDDPTTLVDFVKGVDHLTVTLDSTYGLDPTTANAIYPAAFFVSTREWVNSPVNAHIHIGGITNNTVSYTPWGYAFRIASNSIWPTGGQSSVLIDVYDNNQVTFSDAKDPTTGNYSHLLGGGYVTWWIAYGGWVTINSFQDNTLHMNTDPTSPSNGYAHAFALSVFYGGTLTVRNGRGNTTTSLGGLFASAELWYYNDDNSTPPRASVADFGADFLANNPNWLPGGTIRDNTIANPTSGGNTRGTLIW